ncbi:MAG: fused MFS/spermidine synthase [Nitrospinae bacterium]|nr:fused MFS/spermidine synthase [Nitrospinota bacterium]
MAYLIYTAAIGISAFLLFLVQPMIAKMILPVFGGGASVWLTGMIFFQALLFAGYAASNFMVLRFGRRWHLVVQTFLLLISLFFVPFPAHYAAGDGALPPSAAIFLLLLSSVGVPYFVLSTTSPVVQSWLARDGRFSGANPYVQYAVSNAGSLAGLFAYPLFAETRFTTGMQAALWAAGYSAYAALLVASIYCSHASAGRVEVAEPANEAMPKEADWRVRRGWMAQAMIPSAALIAVTHYLTQDVVNFPLLWVLPLALYLLSFVVCFSVPAMSVPGRGRALMALVPVLLLLLFHDGMLESPYYMKIVTALLGLFAVCMFFHGNLERGKPQKGLLTSFYMYVSLGGLAGSILAGIVAPVAFKTQFEFNMVILASMYFIVTTDIAPRRGVRLAFNGALGVAACAGWLQQEGMWKGGLVFAGRSFYGAYRVEDIRAAHPEGGLRQLVAGTHVHGMERIGGRGEPLAYYHKGSGVGLAFAHLPSIRRVAAVGLGSGAVAAYGQAGGRIDFYELDPLVANIAQNYFSYIQNSRAQVNIIAGDGRLNLRKAPDGFYDMVIVDAFTSGSIPAHLVTREFVRECFMKTGERGLVMFNISNRHVDLLPVLAGNARLLGLDMKKHVAPADEDAGKFTALWVALSRRDGPVASLAAGEPAWADPGRREAYWADDYSNVWSLLRLGAD